MTEAEHLQHCAAIIDSIGEGVITVDSNMIITAFNPAASKITGHTREEAIGRSCAELFCSAVYSAFCPVRAMMQEEGARCEMEKEILRKDGRRVPVKMNATVLRNPRGEITGAVKMLRDLSAELPHRRAYATTAPGMGTTEVAMRCKKCPSREQLAEILARYHGNRQKVAEALGIERTTLWRWMNRVGLKQYSYGDHLAHSQL